MRKISQCKQLCATNKLLFKPLHSHRLLTVFKKRALVSNSHYYSTNNHSHQQQQGANKKLTWKEADDILTEAKSSIEQGDYYNASQRLLNIIQQGVEDKELLMNVHHQLGTCFYMLNDANAAQAHLQTAAKYGDEIKNVRQSEQAKKRKTYAILLLLLTGALSAYYYLNAVPSDRNDARKMLEELLADMEMQRTEKNFSKAMRICSRATDLCKKHSFYVEEVEMYQHRLRLMKDLGQDTSVKALIEKAITVFSGYQPLVQSNEQQQLALLKALAKVGAVADLTWKREDWSNSVYNKIQLVCNAQNVDIKQFMGDFWSEYGLDLLHQYKGANMAFICFQKALSSGSNDKNVLLLANYGLGSCFLQWNDLVQAGKHLQNAAQIVNSGSMADTPVTNFVAGNTLISVALISYMLTGQSAQSLALTERGEEFLKRAGDNKQSTLDLVYLFHSALAIVENQPLKSIRYAMEMLSLKPLQTANYNKFNEHMKACYSLFEQKQFIAAADLAHRGQNLCPDDRARGCLYCFMASCYGMAGDDSTKNGYQKRGVEFAVKCLSAEKYQQHNKKL